MVLAPLIFGSAVAYLVAAAILGYLYTRDGGEHLKWWSLAFGSSVVRQIVGAVIVLTGSEHFLPIALYAIVVAAGLFLMRGTYAFVGRQFSPLWYVAGTGCVAWALGATLLEADFVVITIPVFFFRGVTDIVTGVTILRNERKAGALITGLAFVLWGLHRWDYPFLRHVEWFAPWGFELAASLGVAVAVGMLTLHYERTREELLLKDESYRNLFENSIEGFIRTDGAGNILAANPALVDILGYESEAELRTLNMATDIYADPDARARLAAKYSKVDFLDGVEVTWKRKDGTLRDVRLMTRQFTVDGEIQFEGSVQDITEQKALREQLEVARRMESLGRLAGGVAHDFNNILTAIIGGVELARLDAVDDCVPVKELETIDIAARQGVELSRRLLAFSRQDVEVRVPQDISEVLANSEAMLSRLLPTTVELTIDVQDEVLHVMSEPGQIERVIVNLAVNAEQAMPDGGKLTIRASRAGEKVVLTTSDTGVGMDEAIAERIFEPFFTTKGVGGGTGLGLATTFKIVEALEGSIEVSSKPGKGTTITLTLPACAPPDEAERPPTVVPDSGDGHLVVLLAEDNPIVRRNLVRYLVRCDIEVIEASDGQEALELGLAEAARIDVAVFDIVMPGLTGPEAASRLNRDIPDLPVLFMSGYAAEALKEKGIDEDRFLAKPFAPNDLVSKIRALAGAKASR